MIDDCSQVGLMERVEIEMTSDSSNQDGIKKAIAAGFFYNTSRLQRDGTYKTVKHPQTVHIHPSSSLIEVGGEAGRGGGAAGWHIQDREAPADRAHILKAAAW